MLMSVLIHLFSNVNHVWPDLPHFLRGGVNLCLIPGPFVACSKAHMLSEDGSTECFRTCVTLAMIDHCPSKTHYTPRNLTGDIRIYTNYFFTM